ncbi:hypothetical protein F511_38264 [Dorcoceras hygrometricum]|uniref:Uncharacterized protein n=1 Tax=Dorcoceras hygrometricum TaxID=472368 RepID=A0A2Z7D5D2_9LAMI|nr:hypothetical protein F511_38264 [Dorcoceras hygrometricum]
MLCDVVLELIADLALVGEIWFAGVSVQTSTLVNSPVAIVVGVEGSVDWRNSLSRRQRLALTGFVSVIRQSGPRPDSRLLRQTALEVLKRSARSDSPRKTRPEQIPAKLRRRRRHTAAAAAAARRRALSSTQPPRLVGKERSSQEVSNATKNSKNRGRNRRKIAKERDGEQYLIRGFRA